MTEYDKLDGAVIKNALEDFGNKVTVTVLEGVNSTNTYAKSIADGTIRLVASEFQTAGRGRLGRSFFSPEGKGIYMSLVLPVKSDKNPVMYTVIAAVAAARVIDKIADRDAKIKWVNDIFCSGKKVCGILCEGIINPVSGILREAVIGIGMNLYSEKEDFPEDISEIAASVFPRDVTRSGVIGMLANEIIAISEDCGMDTVIEEYKARLFILGKRIRYIKNGVQYEGIASDVNGEGSLVVITDSGEEVLSSGEITLGSDAFTE